MRFSRLRTAVPLLGWTAVFRCKSDDGVARVAQTAIMVCSDALLETGFDAVSIIGTVAYLM